MMAVSLSRGSADLRPPSQEPPSFGTSRRSTNSLHSMLALALGATALAAVLIAINLSTEGRSGLLDALAVIDLAGLGTVLVLAMRQLRRINAQIAQDLTGLDRAKQTAETANLAKSRYLASVSHEIRSPLNAIYGYAQLFERGDGVNAREAGRVILRCAEHLTNLVEGLLDISQLEFGMLRVRSEEVRLAPFIDQIVSMMRPAANAKGLALHCHLPERLPDVVRLDQSRFRQVLINLLSNAIKFTERGSVTLKVGYSGQIATFEVRDTGPGIPPEEHERIFERFERGSTAVTPGAGTAARTKPGAGLGLAIARTIVEILGGKLELESEVGAGSCFRITMMLGEVSGRIAVHAPARRLIGYEGRKRSILLVEDDRDQREFVERLLGSLGFTVRACGTGEAALESSAESLDLAILDISLPGISGWETGAALRRHYGTALQVLMLSANSEEFHRPEFEAPAHDRFLVKPVEFEMLVETIGELLRLTWRWDSAGEGDPADACPGATVIETLDENAAAHVARLKEFLRIGYVRGIEAEIKLLEDSAPDAEPLVRRLYDCLDRYDLAGMARLLKEGA